MQKKIYMEIKPPPYNCEFQSSHAHLKLPNYAGACTPEMKLNGTYSRSVTNVLVQIS